MADERRSRYKSTLSGAQITAALRDMAQRISERFAKGTVNGIPVSRGEVGFEDNSLFYKNEAENAATNAQAAAQQVAQTAPQAIAAAQSAEASKNAAASSKDQAAAYAAALHGMVVDHELFYDSDTDKEYLVTKYQDNEGPCILFTEMED